MLTLANLLRMLKIFSPKLACGKINPNYTEKSRKKKSLCINVNISKFTAYAQNFFTKIGLWKDQP